MTPSIITCPQWGARPPRHEAELVTASQRIIFHHTAGHHPEISPPGDRESRDEAVAYARAVQAFHMDVNGWDDSGHNFLVCRNGLVLQGRWHTVSAIEGRRMVRSAHCPGENGQVGIEHEHVGTETMTAAQAEASAWLQAWVAYRYRQTRPLPVRPHSDFYATSCPGSLVSAIARVHARAAVLLENMWR